MKKYIFFRTDRIGDFLMSAVLFKSIKRSDPKSKIIIVTSKNNHNYIKNSKLIDEAILYPETIIKKILFYLNFFFQKFYLVGILDGKKRSIYFSFLVRAQFKFLFTYKNFYKVIFKIFFTKIFFDRDFSNKLSEIKALLKFLNFDFINEDLNTIDNRQVLSRSINLLNSDNFILFHLDEKWIFKDYIQSYNSIEPKNEEDFFNFLKKIILKSNLDLVITTGFKKNKFIYYFKKKFKFISNNVYFFNVNNNKIFLYDSLSFFDLEKLILSCNTIITCHGAPSHVAASFEKKIIDIIDNSEREFFLKWTSHFRNHHLISRQNFDLITYEIINLL